MPQYFDPKAATSFDREVGSAIRARRLAVGVSQKKLAEIVGVTFQQVQKYEWGKNRISLHRAAQIALALGCKLNDLLPPGIY